MKNIKSLLVLNVIYIIAGLGVYALLLTLMVCPLQPEGYSLTHWQKQVPTGWVDLDIPIIEPVTQNITPMVLKTNFPKMDNDTLVIPRQSGNSIDVSLNGRRIYVIGDDQNPTANLWNYVHLVKLPEPLSDQNEIVIKLSSSYYATGLNNVPYLSQYASATKRVTYLNWLYDDLLQYIAGSAFIVGVSLILLARIRRKLWGTEWYIGLGLLLSVVFIQDAAFRLTFGNTNEFFIIKKIILISGYLSSLCLLNLFLEPVTF